MGYHHAAYNISRHACRRAFQLAGEHAIRFVADLKGYARDPRGIEYQIPRGMNGIDYFNLCRGQYEKPDIDLLGEHFDNDNVIVEIGANIGIVSSYAYANNLNAGGRMICIEPNTNSLPALRKNITSRVSGEATKDFKIVAAAVNAPSADGQEVEFLRKNCLSSRLVSCAGKDGRGELVGVKSRSLSSILKEEGIQDYSLICDAEGGEIPLIWQDPRALSRCRQIEIELHHPSLTGQPETPDMMEAELRNLGFYCRARIENSYVFAR